MKPELTDIGHAGPSMHRISSKLPTIKQTSTKHTLFKSILTQQTNKEILSSLQNPLSLKQLSQQQLQSFEQNNLTQHSSQTNKIAKQQQSFFQQNSQASYDLRPSFYLPQNNTNKQNTVKIHASNSEQHSSTPSSDQLSSLHLFSTPISIPSQLEKNFEVIHRTKNINNTTNNINNNGNNINKNNINNSIINQNTSNSNNNISKNIINSNKNINKTNVNNKYNDDIRRNKNNHFLFNPSTLLPLHSSPVPTKRSSSGSFDYDCSLNSMQAIKNSLSCSNIGKLMSNLKKTISSSAPVSYNCLLGSFEESMMKGRIEAAGMLEGFRVEIGASGNFHPPHISLPCRTFYFSLSDDNAPSPYLGHVDLNAHSKKGYRIPSQGTVQLTLFNPNNSVLKIFVIKYDVSDMPAHHQTIVRQRTLYMDTSAGQHDEHVHLKYLVHLRLCSTKKGRVYLHTDIRLIFARDTRETGLQNYELRSFTEMPNNPTYTPRSLFDSS